MIEEQTFKRLSIFFVLAILAVLSIIILWPISSAIITGLVLAYILSPVYKKVKFVVKEKTVSALIIIMLVLALIVIPLWFLFPIIVRQLFDVYLFLQKINFFKLISSLFPSLASTSISQDFALSLNKFVSSAASVILSGASSIIFNLPSIALKVVVVFFVFFFGMRDAELLGRYILSLSPFSKQTESELTQKFKDITNSVIFGHIIVGVLQGILTGIGLFALGVPQALVLTVIAIFASVIPILGSWLVWIPASIYLFISVSHVSGIVLFLYGAIFISWIDNIIKPYIISRKTHLSSGVVLVGMIGGLIVFGLLGLIVGPLILAYLLLILDAYRNNRFPSLFSK